MISERLIVLKNMGDVKDTMVNAKARNRDWENLGFLFHYQINLSEQIRKIYSSVIWNTISRFLQ